MTDSTNPGTYWEAVVGYRSIHADQDLMLEGRVLISAETSGTQYAENGLPVFIEENFDIFMHYVRFLRPADQELVLTYYLLRLTQSQLAHHHIGGTATQTVSSFNLRESVRALCFYIHCCGIPTQPQLAAILEPLGMEHLSLRAEYEPDPNVNVRLSELIISFQELGSLMAVAKHYKVHHPLVRRRINDAADAFSESTDQIQNSMGGYLGRLMDKVDAKGSGFSKRQQTKFATVVRTDPPGLGDFRISVDSEEFDSLFAPKSADTDPLLSNVTGI